jgi:hypothetical protein
MGIDKVAEFLRLEATAAVSHPVCAGFQPPLLPRSADVIIVQESRIPEVKVDRETVHLDVQEKRGREVVVKFQGLESLSLVQVSRRNLKKFTGVSNGGATPCKMPDGSEFDARTNMVEDPAET